MSIVTINPSTGEPLAEYATHSPKETEEKLIRAHNLFQDWRKTKFSHRSELMKNAAKILRDNKESYGCLMALEMGKPLAQGLAEAEKCAWVCEYYAENAEEHLKDQFVKTEASDSFITYQPIGTVLAIMPWNFPFWQVFRFAAPALMAGNAGALKHARNTMGCAIEIERIFANAGFPEGLFVNLQIGSSAVASVIENPLIAAVTLTGSTPVGSQVAALAGKTIKKTVLELGGSDPYVVLEDADLEQTVDTCATARLINSGQSCIAAKRFIVVEPLVKDFTELLVEKMRLRKTGDPLDPETTVGPQARKDLQLDLQRQTSQSVAQGAKIMLGGDIPDSPGFFYPPTVLTGVKKGMPAYDEELFGPVAPIISASNEREAIEIANDTEFGLGAAVFTRDIERGRRIAREELQAGCVFVNDFVKSDPRLPFGGIKQSGYGRELSPFGIKEFMNIKSIVVK